VLIEAPFRAVMTHSDMHCMVLISRLHLLNIKRAMHGRIEFELAIALCAAAVFVKGSLISPDARLVKKPCQYP
jgi:hypothetical protein